MAIDIIGHISGEVAWSAAKKTAMLDDFAYGIGYQDVIGQDDEGVDIPNPVTKKEHANNYLKSVVKNTVEDYRLKEAKKAATFTELDAWE